MPTWCHQSGPYKGAPLSWAHYVVGIDYMARLEARRQLRTRDAVRMAQPGVDQAAYTKWRNEHMLVAGWP